MKPRLLRSALSAFVGASLLVGPMAMQADARPGQGGSMGSRGSHTWSAPPVTRTTPYSTAPMDRSITPRTAPTPGFGAPQMAAPFARPMGYPNRHPFLTGLAGGFLGAGLFGMLSGHGFMGGMHGFFSLLGLLVQIGLVVMFVMWLVRRFRRGAAGGNGFGMGTPRGSMPGAASSPTAPAGGGTPVQITTADYQSFQQTLMDIQTAWNQQNIPAMQQMATPEMVSYFNEQLATLASQGARNVVSDVRFLQGDLAEAWRENGMDYASVAMRYSLIDLTTNATGQVVDGSSTTPVTITEVWTFVRPSRGGRWLLSAIQQAR
ncbi:Tim44-like domain-containing protein [Acetobacter okinawensis]|uniref:Preprotein translocase subunit Tim44 n=1 Tax=Acetobacter okinawensis TaxID=1076594 RepID=A0A252BYS1_9PROT|nr:Tim44-like domain-containing protein [Acetobacter okinawensis]OUJ14073.1 preprotein translocase subunit Tim44 [Acetobacter okinawensis]